MNVNHDYLVELGVSHESLEMIRGKTHSSPYHLSTKLTGAGGGGCAVTLIPDGESGHLYVREGDGLIQRLRTLLDYSDELLQDLVAALEQDGFKTYLASVGGSGLGLLSSSIRAIDTQAPGAGENSHIPLKKAFHESPAEDLARWAESTGDWMYT